MSPAQITLLELRDEYTQARRIELSLEQFTVLATSFPSLLILSTDGQVDECEWDFVNNLSEHLCQATQEELDQQELLELKRLWCRELQYLHANVDTWERKFTKALRHHLAQHGEARRQVLDNIHHSANASEGVCEKEKIMIAFLLRELGIEA